MKKTQFESGVAKLFAAMSAAVALSGCGGRESSVSTAQASDPSTPTPSLAPVPAPRPTAPGISTAPWVTTGLLIRANKPGLPTTGPHGVGVTKAFIQPTAALIKGGSYTIAVAGASNGTAVTKAFLFVPSL